MTKLRERTIRRDTKRRANTKCVALGTLSSDPPKSISDSTFHKSRWFYTCLPLEIGYCTD
jgi:hypothetical protein